MKQVNQLINSALSKKPQQHSTSERQFDGDEAWIINYFFAKLKMTYPADYGFNVQPIEATQKKYYGLRLIGFDKDKIDNGFEFISGQKEKGESKYMKLDIDLAIGAIKEANRSHAAHTLRLPEKRERPTSEEAEAGIAQMRGVLDQ